MSELAEQDKTSDELQSDELQSELAAGLLEAIRGAVAPVLAQLDQLEAEIERREQELRELRQLRTNATRVLHALDPSTKPGPKAKAKTRGADRARYSARRLDELAEWLRAHFTPDDDIAIPPLLARDDFALMPRQALNGALPALVDQGVLRLDRLEKVTSQAGRPSRVYRLIPER